MTVTRMSLVGLTRVESHYTVGCDIIGLRFRGAVRRGECDVDGRITWR